MEQDILDQYQLRTADPNLWEEDSFYVHSTESEENRPYTQLLEEVTKDDVKNTPSLTDPIDPLNPRRTIKQVLRQRGAESTDEESLLKLSIASKSFNSKVFLKLIHKDDSFDQLVESLNLLENSIEQQNQQLKGLIQREFLRFVRSKSSLDDILLQFQEKGFRGGGDGEDQKDGTGLKGLKTSMNNANRETAVLIKPMLATKLREDKLKLSIEFVEKKKFFFDLPKSLKSSLQDGDYDSFVRDYKKAKHLREDGAENGENSKIVDRIWESVEIIVDSYKKQLWGQLNNDRISDEFLKIIKKLLELDEIDNPILEWIEFKSRKLLFKFNEVFKKYHDKILNVQLNILSTVDLQDYTNFKSVLNRSVQLIDYTIVIEMWLTINKLYGHFDSIIQEFIQFWKHVQMFVNGTYREKLVSKYVDEDSPYLNFQSYEIEEIKLKGKKFIDQVIHKLIRFFTSTQDSLKLISHTSPDGNSTDSNNGNLSGLIQDFGFLPPFTNSLSTFRYLPLISKQTFKILDDLGQLTIADRITSELRDTSDLITERIIGAVCASWLNDCQNFYKLEDWSRLVSGETAIPNLIYDFEVFVLEKIGDLLLKSSPQDRKISIVKYPKKKFLNGIQTQFLRSFDVLLESIIKNIIEEGHNPSISKNVRNNHKLLTYFNLRKLTDNIIPKVLVKFDSIFETKLQSENLEIYAILEKLEVTIFDSYMNEQKKIISSILTKSILAIDWSDSSSRVTKVSPYIYETINVLIGVYIGVLSVSSELIERVFQHLLEHASAVLLKNFRDVTGFSDSGFRQTVLDIEFFKSLVGKSANDTTTTNFKLIYKTFNAAHLDITTAYNEIGDHLDESLRASSIQYEIFNS
jgi:exocyst complex component 2